MIPKVLALPRNLDEVGKVFAYAREKRLPVTIRAAGSSLSGQSQGDGILLEARRHWAGCSVEEGGAVCLPGPALSCSGPIFSWHRTVTASDRTPPARVSARSAALSPTMPAACGAGAQNSYKTISSLTFVLGHAKKGILNLVVGNASLRTAVISATAGKQRGSANRRSRSRRA
jgi:D-lactate dehydrogenase